MEQAHRPFRARDLTQHQRILRGPRAHERERPLIAGPLQGLAHDLAVDRDEFSARDVVKLTSPVDEAFLIRDRIEASQHAFEGVVRRRAKLSVAVARQVEIVGEPIALEASELSDSDGVVGAGDGGAQRHENNVGERVFDLAGASARIAKGAEMAPNGIAVNAGRLFHDNLHVRGSTPSNPSHDPLIYQGPAEK